MKATSVFRRNWEAIHAKNPDGSRKYKYIINTGSSRSSKTYSLIDCYDLYARSNEGKRLTVWRDTKTDCRKTVLADVLKHFKRTNRYKVDQEFNKTESIFSYSTSSTFEIHGTDDEETVHGLSQSAAWFNEPYKISKDTFDQIDQRTEDFIFIDWNPKKNHFIDDIAKDPRAIVIHSTFRDNPFCPIEERLKILSYQPVNRCAVVLDKILPESDAKEYDLINNPLDIETKKLNELIRCRENEAKNSADDFKWDVYGLGIKGERPHRIFRWKPISLEEYKSLTYSKLVGSDWGDVDPWGVLEAKYSDGKLYLHELNYESENEIRSRLTPTELAQINGTESTEHKTERTGLTVWRFNQLNITTQTRIICDHNKPLKTAALRRAGYSQAMPAVNKSILDGIRLLSNLQVFYTSCSANLEYEQENYTRKLDANGNAMDEPEDRDNHLIDPARWIALDLYANGIIPPDMM